MNGSASVSSVKRRRAFNQKEESNDGEGTVEPEEEQRHVDGHCTHLTRYELMVNRNKNRPPRIIHLRPRKSVRHSHTTDPIRKPMKCMVPWRPIIVSE